MLPRCKSADGCTTILRVGNKTGLCGAHEKRKSVKWMSNEAKLSRSAEFIQREAATKSTREAEVLEKVLKATNVFFCTLTEMEHDGLTFSQEVAVFLLHNDFHLSLRAIGRNLRVSHNTATRSYYKIFSMSDASPDLRRNLEAIRETL